MPSETIQQLLRERATSDSDAVKYGDDAWTARLREVPAVADEFARRYHRGWGRG